MSSNVTPLKGDQASGTFLGTEVRTGPGGGLASGPATTSGSTTHYHAARLPELGDVVLAVTRLFDPSTAAALRIELRAFTAAAPARGALVSMDGDDLMHSPGAIAYAQLELSAPGDAADERREATLEHCVVTDAAPTAAAARGVAQWLRATWETELAFGSWPAVRGTLDAFSVDGGATADWAEEWLRETEHQVDHSTQPSRFLKVLSAAWIEPAGAAVEQPDAATDPR